MPGHCLHGSCSFGHAALGPPRLDVREGPQRPRPRLGARSASRRCQPGRHRGGADRAQHRRRRLRRDRQRSTARNEITQHSVELVGDTNPLCSKVGPVPRASRTSSCDPHRPRPWRRRAMPQRSRPRLRRSHRSCGDSLETAHAPGPSRCSEHPTPPHREQRATAQDDDPARGRPQPPTVGQRTASPIASARDIRPSRRRPSATRPVCSLPDRPPWRCGVLVRVDSDDHVHAPFRVAVGKPRSACRLLDPGSRDHTSVEPDRSRSPAGRQTPGEPARRRQTLHEPTRPTTYRTLRTPARHRPAPLMPTWMSFSAVPSGAQNVRPGRSRPSITMRTSATVASVTGRLSGDDWRGCGIRRRRRKRQDRGSDCVGGVA